ncbi:MAG: hypothetical protein BM485_03650 [Desulfobulbaceae bacterium DB1]|nr:MAG: hypothetical protein BM485_03650 [Desulfobulbaceae bacterium DB1]
MREIDARPGEAVQVKCRLKYDMISVAQLPKKYEQVVYSHDQRESLGIGEYIKIIPTSSVVVANDQEVSFTVMLEDRLNDHSMVNTFGPLPVKVFLEYEGSEGKGGSHDLGIIRVYPKQNP